MQGNRPGGVLEGAAALEAEAGRHSHQAPQRQAQGYGGQGPAPADCAVHLRYGRGRLTGLGMGAVPSLDCTSAGCWALFAGQVQLLEQVSTGRV